jgi:hypothetical protein
MVPEGDLRLRIRVCQVDFPIKSLTIFRLIFLYKFLLGSEQESRETADSLQYSSAEETIRVTLHYKGSSGELRPIVPVSTLDGLYAGDGNVLCAEVWVIPCATDLSGVQRFLPLAYSRVHCYE